MTTLIFLYVLMILTALKIFFQGIFLIHRLQQLGYDNLKYMKWLEGKQYRKILLWNIFELILPLFIMYILYIFIKEIPIYKYITSTIILATFSWKIIHSFIAGWVGPGAKAETKIPLKYTARVIRLFFSLSLVAAIIIISVFLLTTIPLDSFTLSTMRFFQFNAFLLFISVITPIIILITNLINIPFERLISIFYFYKAKYKIKKLKLIKIAITGSYGKTSTKFFLSGILGYKLKTLHTPASYNTPMGISKVINNADLKNYECFIAEMGADHRGEINTLCRLVKPDFGIITSIDFQHLETFGSIENIIETKLSLFNNISDNGFGIYNFDNEILRENIYKNKFNVRLFSYSVKEKNFNNVDIIAEDLTHDENGLAFKCKFKTGELLCVNTEVLGRHNASNLLACILMAKLLGLNTGEILEGIKNIRPVEHRLQKIISPTGVIILDDAFNSNLNGACEALWVLREMEGNKKIIVTPGLIGLGEKEDESNKIFGRNISQFADIAILVGKKRTEKIYEGMAEKKFDNENIYIVNSLNEGKVILGKILKQKDVVLFENDLPDTFSE